MLINSHPLEISSLILCAVKWRREEKGVEETKRLCLLHGTRFALIRTRFDFGLQRKDEDEDVILSFLIVPLFSSCARTVLFLSFDYEHMRGVGASSHCSGE